MQNIKVHRIPLGNYRSNCYLVQDIDTNNALIIDCCDGEELQIYIDKNNLDIEITYGLLTHGHFDHVLGVKYIQKKFNTMFFVGREDLYAQEDEPYLFPRITKLNVVFDNSTLSLGDFSVNCIATPGHTKGSFTYQIQDNIFTGDTLFKGTVGRTDLYGGSFKELMSSIRERLIILPEDTVVFPGHGSETTIGEEIKFNEFLKDL